MRNLRNARSLTISIDFPPDRVYAFVSNGVNMPRWMTSFVRSVKKTKSGWIAETPDGEIEFQFVPPNEYGVLDHWIKPPSGAEVRNPMRVVPNGDGAEVIFTLFQLPGMSDDRFAQDAGMVEHDLRMLKTVLEK